MKLTNREKTLLMILATFVIVVGGMVLLIMPLKQKISALQEETSALELESVQMRVGIQTHDEVIKKMETSLEALGDTLSAFEDPLKNENFDEKVYKLARKQDISIEHLKYNKDKLEFPNVTFGQENELEYELKAEIDRFNKGIQEDKVPLVSNYEIISKSVTISVIGNSGKIEQFIDELYSGFNTLYIDKVKINFETGASEIELLIFSIDKIGISKHYSGK